MLCALKTMELDEVVSVEFYFMGTETEGLLALER